jgi:hypothetical protein
MNTWEHQHGSGVDPENIIRGALGLVISDGSMVCEAGPIILSRTELCIDAKRVVRTALAS